VTLPFTVLLASEEQRHRHGKGKLLSGFRRFDNLFWFLARPTTVMSAEHVRMSSECLNWPPSECTCYDCLRCVVALFSCPRPCPSSIPIRPVPSSGVFYFNSNELCRQVQRVNREQRQPELRTANAVHSTGDILHSEKNYFPELCKIIFEYLIFLKNSGIVMTVTFKRLDMKRFS